MTNTKEGKTMESNMVDAGRKAHALGMVAAPALDRKFIEAIADGGAARLAKAWLRGWHTANLEAR